MHFFSQVQTKVNENLIYKILTEQNEQNKQIYNDWFMNFDSFKWQIVNQISLDVIHSRLKFKYSYQWNWITPYPN